MKTLLFLMLCLSLPVLAKQPIPVIAYKVTQTVENLSFIAVGQTRAFDSIIIKMPTKGYIQKVHFLSGQAVKKGEVIVSQNADLLNIQRKRDQLLINKTASKNKKKNRKNYAFQDAILKLQQTKVAIKQKQFTAPFSGVLGLISVSEGAFITPETSISTLDDVSQIRVSFELSESKFQRVNKSTPIKVFSKQHSETGKINFLGTRFNKNKRSITVEGIIKNSKGSIKPGMFVDVEVVVKNAKAKIFVPMSAVKNEKDATFIFIIVKNKIIKTKVTLGRQKTNQIQILSGLKGAELIVARGLSKLKHLDVVEVIDYLVKG